MSGIYPSSTLKIIDTIRMRYSTSIDGKNYHIDRPDDDLLMLDRVARELATLVAHKIYGKRQGAVCWLNEARTGRRREPPRYWTFEAVIGRQDKMGRTLEWHEIPLLITETPTPPPKPPRPPCGALARSKKTVIIPTPTLADILNAYDL